MCSRLDDRSSTGVLELGFSQHGDLVDVDPPVRMAQDSKSQSKSKNE